MYLAAVFASVIAIAMPGEALGWYHACFFMLVLADLLVVNRKKSPST
jgi:hypothetical protein